MRHIYAAMFWATVAVLIGPPVILLPLAWFCLSRAIDCFNSS